MKKVIVTGASGFVGSHTARRLLREGWEVAALLRSGASARRIADIQSHLRTWEGDLADTMMLRRRLTEWRPDACIHCAWYTEPGKYLQAAENLQSLSESAALLKELIAVECQTVVMAGTCAEYDTEPGFLQENGATRPATLYGAAKLAMAVLGQQLAANGGISFCWARLFYLYGPHEDERRIIPALIRALLAGRRFAASEGEQIRDYLHVEDVACALATLIRSNASGVFNISSGAPVSMRTVMQTVGDLLGQRHQIDFGVLPDRDWDPPCLFGDNRRLRALCWKPHYSLPAGLEMTIDWWRHCGE
jgi:nucleoside-diphosphate-sugar epimerase